MVDLHTEKRDMWKIIQQFTILFVSSAIGVEKGFMTEYYKEKYEFRYEARTLNGWFAWVTAVSKNFFGNIIFGGYETIQTFLWLLQLEELHNNSRIIYNFLNNLQLIFHSKSLTILAVNYSKHPFYAYEIWV